MHLKKGDWFQDVDTFNGQNRRSKFENLMAFWPGVLALMGEINESSRILNAFFLVWHDWGFMPEVLFGDIYIYMKCTPNIL